MVELGERKEWWFINDAFEVVKAKGTHQSGCEAGWRFRGTNDCLRQSDEVFETKEGAKDLLRKALNKHIDFYKSKLEALEKV